MPPESERARLMDAAFRSLAQSEGSSLSVTDVLTTAGLSTRAFYRHFGSKDELLLALFRRDGDRVTAQLAVAAAEAAEPRDALTAWVDGMLQIAADPRRRRRVPVLSSEEITRARGYAAERRRNDLEQQAGIARILERGREDGSFPWTNPEPDARSIRAALGHAFLEQITGVATVPPSAASRQVADFALRAVGAAHRELDGRAAGDATSAASRA